jgi:hypothetical protein
MPANMSRRPKSGSGHQTDMPTVFRDVRFKGQSGKHLLALSISEFDLGCVKTPTLNLHVEFPSRFRRCKRLQGAGATDQMVAPAHPRD